MVSAEPGRARRGRAATSQQPSVNGAHPNGLRAAGSQPLTSATGPPKPATAAKSVNGTAKPATVRVNGAAKPATVGVNGAAKPATVRVNGAAKPATVRVNGAAKPATARAKAVNGATAPTPRPPSAPVPAPEPSTVTPEFRAFAGRTPDVWDDRVADVLAFLRRRITGEYDVDEFGFDPDLTDSVVYPLLRLLYRHYFRVECTGLENLPPDGSALLVANHSGTVPIDALMLSVAVHDETPRNRHLRLLAADLVFRVPILSELARKTGGTLACNPDAERMLRNGEYVGVFPEGFKGVGKPYRDRYKLQRFGRGGFVSAALRTGTPIVPVSIVGAEEIYPIIGNLGPVAKAIGLPYVPITPLFPWLGLLGLVPLPSKWLIEFGPPIETTPYAGEVDDPIVVFNLADQVRETIQHTLHALLERRPDPFG